MKRQVRIAVGIAIVLLLALAVTLLRRKSEPEYNGRPLSDWLTQLVSNYPRMDREAVQALNAMGDRAVHPLIETVENEDSPLKAMILQHSDRLPMLEEYLTSKSWGRFIAVKALAELGTNATAAVPALRKLDRPGDYMLAPAARAALVLIQNQSIDALVTNYFDYGSTNSSKAFGLLLQLGPHAKSAIPGMLEGLQSTNDRIRLSAALVLQSVGIESPECVSVFTNMLTDPNRSIRNIGIGGLGNCGAMATSAAPAVVELLDDPESLCRSSVLIYLSRVIPPEAFQPFRAKVQQATRDADQNVRELAEHVLREKESSK